MQNFGAVAISPDGKMLAVGEADSDTIRVWERKSVKLKEKLKAHGVVEMAFSPEAGSLVSAGRDGKVIVWDVLKQKPRDTFDGHTKHEDGVFLSCVAFAPDGQTVASGSWDGTMRIWPAASPHK